MLDKLQALEDRYLDLEAKISDPEVIADQTNWLKATKAHAKLEPIVTAYREYRDMIKARDEAEELLAAGDDEELVEMAKEELKELKPQIEEYEEKLTILLLPSDPNDVLFRMYLRYAETRGWRVEVMDSNPTELGGFKEIVFQISGDSVYSRMKFESGVHRVQRIPATESGGRIHTSTVTVAVLPEAEEVDVHIDMNDVRVDVFRASGNGGQCVNTTDSAVRMTHIPTGIVVSCQNEKSQLKNKEQALKVLYARVYERERQAHDAAISADRRSQVGTGDRSERIRTYNFPQGRVTDHRVGLTLHRIDAILDGDLDEIMDTLVTTDQMEKLKAQNPDA